MARRNPYPEEHVATARAVMARAESEWYQATAQGQKQPWRKMLRAHWLAGWAYGQAADAGDTAGKRRAAELAGTIEGVVTTVVQRLEAAAGVSRGAPYRKRD